MLFLFNLFVIYFGIGSILESRQNNAWTGLGDHFFAVMYAPIEAAKAYYAKLGNF